MNEEDKANCPQFPVNKASVAISLIHINLSPLLSPCLLLYHTCLKVSLVSWIFSIMTKISSPVSWAFSYKQNKMSSDTSLTYMYHTHTNSCRYVPFCRYHLGNDCEHMSSFISTSHVRVLWNILLRHLRKCVHLFCLLYNYILEMILQALSQYAMHVLLLIFYFWCIFKHFSICFCGFGLILYLHQQI